MEKYMEIQMTTQISVCEDCRRHTAIRYVRHADKYLCEWCEENACEEHAVREPDDDE